MLLSIFAGALSDRRGKKRTMLVSDSAAAVCAVALFAIIGLVGVLSCLPFRRDRHIWALEGLDSRGKMKMRR